MRYLPYIEMRIFYGTLVLKSLDFSLLDYKDWGTGQPIVFSHGWPLNADAWDGQLFFLASNGYRTIAHDRRGHGRSSQPWNGNEMDTYADDLAALIETLAKRYTSRVVFVDLYRR